MTRLRTSSLVLFVALALCTAARADEPFRYPEAAFGKGELKFVDGIPVLVVQGKPEEIGEQVGVLSLKPAAGIMNLADGFVKAQGWERLYPLFLKTGNFMKPQFPPHHLAELQAAAKASGWPEDLLVFANTISDLRKIGGCSTLFIDAERSTTGGPLFGRNVDWPPFGPLHEYPLVVVYRGEGKLALASIAFPGIVGVFSGMNEKGLAVADLTVIDSKDGSARFDAGGVPYGLALRRVLEECSTIDEAEKLLRSIRRTTRENFAICDRSGGAVFEVTPKNLVVRRSVEGICACTNHFRTAELATSTECPRYQILDESRRIDHFDVAAVAKQMDAVNQGAMTLETMVFEPATLKLHLAYGKGPATKLPLRTVDLSALFTEERVEVGSRREPQP